MRSSWLPCLRRCRAVRPCWPAADSLQAREEQAIKAAVARVAPSVVRIETVGGLERVGRCWSAPARPPG